MEESTIAFIFQTLTDLAAQHPELTWVGTVLAVLMSMCGICAVASIWMPAPMNPTGLYATVYTVVHAMAAHFGQNKGAIADGNSVRVQSEVDRVKGY